MGFRFRKSINLGKHFRINLSKNGVGYSYGVKGYRRTISADGKKKDTYTLPETGISYTSSTKSQPGSSRSQKSADLHPRKNNSGAYYFISFISLLIAIGCAFSRSTFGIFLFVILSFLFCVAGKKAKWAYEDYLEEIEKSQEVIKNTEETSNIQQTSSDTPSESSKPSKNYTSAPISTSVSKSYTPNSKKKITISFPVLQSDENNICWLKKYEYDYKICLFDVSASDLVDLQGSRVRFQLEPDNPVDPRAVAAYINGKKIGYAYKGFMQDMLYDWIRRDDMFGAGLQTVDSENNQAILKIAFYKPQNTADTKVFPLIKTSKKDYLETKRSENLMYCNVGDEIEIENDPVDDIYLVSCNGFEVGELGASFKKWIEENNYYTYVGEICDIDDTDDHVNAKVKIFAY